MVYTPAQQMAFLSLEIPPVCLEPKELEIYDATLRKLKPKLCLEWGAGWSTVYFPSRHPYIERWIAIEHDPAWYHRLTDRVPPSVDLRLCQDAQSYVFDIFDDGLKFDFISVDGRWRDYCMLAASILLKPVAGRCFLHDTGRLAYARWFNVFDHHRKWTEGRDPHPNGGFKGRGLTMFGNDLRKETIT